MLGDLVFSCSAPRSVVSNNATYTSGTDICSTGSQTVRAHRKPVVFMKVGRTADVD